MPFLNFIKDIMFAKDYREGYLHGAEGAVRFLVVAVLVGLIGIPVYFLI
jgi:hypothetical protein|tara:strand:- start:26 stop:172 length:147 start_codon:yes stop_codon:yes gene_type:complete